MINPIDEVYRDLDDQGRSDDNNRTHDEPGFLGDEEQDTAGDTAASTETEHEIPKAMTIEQEGEKPWENQSGSTNLSEEQLEEVESPSTNKGDEPNVPEQQREAQGTGYHEDPDQLKVGGEG
ncbi:MAG: hypothetical protein EOP44_00270 [Sphingobacteriaceae bacterium]|nr:MAG: hypothetical protein EOP44_00270 [Sphingobacteriaceae bacterium]